MFDRNPMQRAFHFSQAGFGAAAAFAVGIITHVNFSDFVRIVFYHAFTFDDVGIF
jgi:hypothetical protein